MNVEELVAEATKLVNLAEVESQETDYFHLQKAQAYLLIAMIEQMQTLTASVDALKKGKP